MSNDYCVELVTFTVADEDVEDYLARRTEAIKEVKAAHPGLWAVPFSSKRTDGSWVDAWIYESEAAATAANADAENLPKFLAMVSLLRDVEIEVTSMPTGAVSPV